MLSLGLSSLPQPDPKKISRIKNWVVSLLKLDISTTVFVTQLECHEKGCPPVETVIALIQAGEKTKQKKIHKCINDIEEKDIINLFSEDK